jgi:hypothetical protein
MASNPPFARFFLYLRFGLSSIGSIPPALTCDGLGLPLYPSDLLLRTELLSADDLRPFNYDCLPKIQFALPGLEYCFSLATMTSLAAYIIVNLVDPLDICFFNFSTFLSCFTYSEYFTLG